jgi:hypothetical protein
LGRHIGFHAGQFALGQHGQGVLHFDQQATRIPSVRALAEQAATRRLPRQVSWITIGWLR